MNTRVKVIKLIVVLLMLAGAALSVNKEIFGIKAGDKENKTRTEMPSDSVSTQPDGSVIIHTAGLSGTKSGYAGAVPLDIRIANGRITEITPLENAETPSFFKRALPLTDNWIGKTPEEALAMKADAVSGATFSSTALISNVRAGLLAYEGSHDTQKESIPLKFWIALGVTLAACILPLFVKNRIYHNLQLAANIIVLGFWCGQFLDYTLMLRYISSGFTLPSAIIAIVMLIAAFIYPLFGHPQYYCNHICPLGAAQQLTAQICKFKIHISPRVLKWLNEFRLTLWGVLMAMLWMDALTGWMDLELFQAFQYESASWWIIGAALLFIVLSAVVSRPYCRFVCPTGTAFKAAENID